MAAESLGYPTDWGTVLTKFRSERIRLRLVMPGFVLDLIDNKVARCSLLLGSNKCVIEMRGEFPNITKESTPKTLDQGRDLNTPGQHERSRSHEVRIEPFLPSSLELSVQIVHETSQWCRCILGSANRNRANMPDAVGRQGKRSRRSHLLVANTIESEQRHW